MMMTPKLSRSIECYPRKTNRNMKIILAYKDTLQAWNSKNISKCMVVKDL